MNYKHLSHIERYQIHTLMKAQHNITQIARMLGRDKSTISHELRRNAGCRGYKAKQACELACKRSESSRNANTLEPWVIDQASLLRPRHNKIHLFKKLTLTSSLGDQFKSGGGEGGLFHEDITFKSGVTVTFAELP
jgi:IS30 family transposase